MNRNFFVENAKGCCCYCRWGENTSLNCIHQWAYCSSPKLYMSMESHGGIMLTGTNQGTRRKTCLIVTWPTTNLTLTDPGLNLGLCSERPATSGLRHGMATWVTQLCNKSGSHITIIESGNKYFNSCKLLLLQHYNSICEASTSANSPFFSTDL
jgi:hypothetical protein